MKRREFTNLLAFPLLIVLNPFKSSDGAFTVSYRVEPPRDRPEGLKDSYEDTSALAEINHRYVSKNLLEITNTQEDGAMVNSYRFKSFFVYREWQKDIKKHCNFSREKAAQLGIKLTKRFHFFS